MTTKEKKEHWTIRKGTVRYAGRREEINRIVIETPISEKAKRVVATIEGPFGGYDPMPDARKIEAAPDMLEALEFALFTIENREGLKDRKDLFTDDERNKLRTAIAKARRIS